MSQTSATVSHTPGPWRETTHHGKPAVKAPDSMGMIVAVMGFTDPTVQAETDANARLIAKAPELRAKLEWFLDRLASEVGDDAEIREARALLAEIDGKDGES